MKHLLLLAVFVASGLVFLVGCGPAGLPLKVEFVTGTVKLDGVVVEGATISFVSVNP
jgi:hypothetical protein